jgi:hypothetical protein
MNNLSAVGSYLFDVDVAEEAPGIVRGPEGNVLATPWPDEPLFQNPPDIVYNVALEYRRAWRVAVAAEATELDCERAAVDAAIGRHQQLDPMAPFNRHDAADTVLEMVGNVILAEPFWFWHGPDA